MKTIEVSVDSIEQNENSRVVYKTAELTDLMASMKRDGLLQPIGLRKLPSGGYECVFGNRRLIAAKKLGWETIPATLTEVDTDIERDFVGLIENMKRKNTTVSEDGRIFQSLRDRGLSVSEIAVRLDVNEIRVKTALDIYTNVPEEFVKKVVYRTPGNNRRMKDVVSASTAIAILNARRTAHLNRTQTRSIFAYAAENNPTVNQIGKIGPLIKGGATVAEAIERVSNVDRISLTIFMPTSNILKLEKKYKKKVHQVLYDYLKLNPEFLVENTTSLPALSGLAKKAEAKKLKQAGSL